MLVLKRNLLREVRRTQKQVTLESEEGTRPLIVDAKTPSLDFSTTSFLTLLSPRESEVMLLRMQSLKYVEIAESLKISPNSVNRLLARAIGKMRAWRGLQESSAGAGRRKAKKGHV